MFEGAIANGIESFVSRLIPRNFRKLTQAVSTFLGNQSQVSRRDLPLKTARPTSPPIRYERSPVRVCPPARMYANRKSRAAPA